LREYIHATLAHLGVTESMLDGLVETEWNFAVAEANLWISRSMVRAAYKEYGKAPTGENRARIVRFSEWESEDRQAFEAASNVLSEMRAIVLALTTTLAKPHR